MTWQTPAFEEINMSAEIGSYQEDDGGGHFPIFRPGSETDACETGSSAFAAAAQAIVKRGAEFSV
jgi:hypothetical protein